MFQSRTGANLTWPKLKYYGKSRSLDSSLLLLNKRNLFMTKKSDDSKFIIANIHNKNSSTKAPSSNDKMFNAEGTPDCSSTDCTQPHTSSGSCGSSGSSCSSSTITASNGHIYVSSLSKDFSRTAQNNHNCSSTESKLHLSSSSADSPQKNRSADSLRTKKHSVINVDVHRASCDSIPHCSQADNIINNNNTSNTSNNNVLNSNGIYPPPKLLPRVPLHMWHRKSNQPSNGIYENLNKYCPQLPTSPLAARKDYSGKCCNHITNSNLSTKNSPSRKCTSTSTEKIPPPSPKHASPLLSDVTDGGGGSVCVTSHHHRTFSNPFPSLRVETLERQQARGLKVFTYCKFK